MSRGIPRAIGLRGQTRGIPLRANYDASQWRFRAKRDWSLKAQGETEFIPLPEAK
jgi:hypothetical protein